MNATADMANTIAMITMVQAVQYLMWMPSPAMNVIIRYGESSCVRTHLPVRASLCVKASVGVTTATVICLFEVICELHQQ